MIASKFTISVNINFIDETSDAMTIRYVCRMYVVTNKNCNRLMHIAQRKRFEFRMMCRTVAIAPCTKSPSTYYAISIRYTRTFTHSHMHLHNKHDLRTTNTFYTYSPIGNTYIHHGILGEVNDKETRRYFSTPFYTYVHFARASMMMMMMSQRANIRCCMSRTQTPYSPYILYIGICLYIHIFDISNILS